MTAAFDGARQTRLLTAYPMQVDYLLGTKVRIFPHSLPDASLVGQYVRYDYADNNTPFPRIVVRVGTDFYFTNVYPHLEFTHEHIDVKGAETSNNEAAALHGLLPPQDMRIRFTFANVNTPEDPTRIVRGRIVRADNTGLRTTLILTGEDEPKPRIYTSLEVLNGICD